MDRLWVLGIASLVAGCSCRPGLPDVPEEQPPREETDRPRGDSADSALPPCTHPEREPNDDAEHAEDLGTDVLGCGIFQGIDDVDVWSFTLVEDAWLAVDVTAFSLGSEARVSVTLVSDELGEAHTVERAGDLPEVHLVFPAPPSSWRAVVRQALGRPRGAGEDYFYEVLASSAKPPLDWDVDEVAGAHGADAPQRLVEADDLDVSRSVLGTIATPADDDWYEVTFPSHGYVVTFDVDAEPHGSAGNFALRVVDETGNELIESDPDAPGTDPRWFRETTGPGSIRAEVFEQGGGAGRPYWYRLTVTVEVP